MAKYQWKAADETVDAAPTGLVNEYTADGQSINDWLVVANAEASGGKVLSFVGTTTLRRRLTLPDVSTTGRIDVRARVYFGNSTSTLARHIAIRIGGTGGSDGVDFNVRRNGRRAENRKQTTGGADELISEIGAFAISSGFFPGWMRIRYTHDPTTNEHYVQFYRDDTGAEVVAETNVHADAAVNGTKVGLGCNGSTSPELWDWMTVGIDGDDADLEPTSGPILTKKLSIPLHSDAVGKTVSGVVCAAAGALELVGAPLAYFSDAVLQAAAGGVTLLADSFGLTVGDNVLVYMQDATHWGGFVNATVIEE